MNLEKTSPFPLLPGLLTALFLAITNPVGAQINPRLLAADNTQFACDLYSRLKSHDGNLFLSPSSISTCLAMVSAGARGDTYDQMARVLHLPPDAGQVHSALGNLQKELATAGVPGKVQLEIANGLWAQQGHPFLPAYLDLVKQDYDGNLRQVDFQTAADPARLEINGWISNRTAGRIPDLFAPGMLGSSTRLVLVNAIYFKGQWLEPFKKERTADAPFHVSSDKQTTASFMHATLRCNHFENADVQAVELRYASNRLSMIVVLPTGTNSLPQLENSLSEKQITQWAGLLLLTKTTQKIEIYLPKFKLTSQFSLARTLTDMGMTDAFSTRADFSGMDGARDLLLSAVVHKAFVEVNEEGTEAAAATGAAMALAAMPVAIPVFRADHPFLFFIRDTQTGSILFMGRVTNPAG